MVSVSPSNRLRESGHAVRFVLLHVAALAVFAVPFTWPLVLWLAGSYLVRMFGVTAGYHRYFSHRSYKLGRVQQALMAVLAHEVGHLNAHHAMRMVLQQSGIAVLVTALAGDAVGMTILAALVPAALVNARYSREFELEADAYALALLKRHDRSPQSFIDVLKSFAEDQRMGDPRDPVLRYLSSHPDLEERIARAEAQR